MYKWYKRSDRNVTGQNEKENIYRINLTIYSCYCTNENPQEYFNSILFMRHFILVNVSLKAWILLC